MKKLWAKLGVIIAVAMMCVCALTACGQTPTEKPALFPEYTPVRPTPDGNYADDAVTVDGTLDEALWENAVWHDMVSTMANRTGANRENIELTDANISATVLVKDKGLYVGIKSDDPVAYVGQGYLDENPTEVNEGRPNIKDRAFAKTGVSLYVGDIADQALAGDPTYAEGAKCAEIGFGCDGSVDMRYAYKNQSGYFNLNNVKIYSAAKVNGALNADGNTGYTIEALIPWECFPEIGETKPTAVMATFASHRYSNILHDSKENTLVWELLDARYRQEWNKTKLWCTYGDGGLALENGATLGWFEEKWAPDLGFDLSGDTAESKQITYDVGRKRRVGSVYARGLSDTEMYAEVTVKLDSDKSKWYNENGASDEEKFPLTLGDCWPMAGLVFQTEPDIANETSDFSRIVLGERLELNYINGAKKQGLETLFTVKRDNSFDFTYGCARENDWDIYGCDPFAEKGVKLAVYRNGENFYYFVNGTYRGVKQFDGIYEDTLTAVGFTSVNLPCTVTDYKFLAGSDASAYAPSEMLTSATVDNTMSAVEDENGIGLVMQKRDTWTQGGMKWTQEAQPNTWFAGTFAFNGYASKWNTGIAMQFVIDGKTHYIHVGNNSNGTGIHHPQVNTDFAVDGNVSTYTLTTEEANLFNGAVGLPVAVHYTTEGAFDVYIEMGGAVRKVYSYALSGEVKPITEFGVWVRTSSTADEVNLATNGYKSIRVRDFRCGASVTDVLGTRNDGVTASVKEGEATSTNATVTLPTAPYTYGETYTFTVDLDEDEYHIVSVRVTDRGNVQTLEIGKPYEFTFWGDTKIEVTVAVNTYTVTVPDLPDYVQVTLSNGGKLDDGTALDPTQFTKGATVSFTVTTTGDKAAYYRIVAVKVNGETVTESSDTYTKAYDGAAFAITVETEIVQADVTLTWGNTLSLSGTTFTLTKSDDDNVRYSVAVGANNAMQAAKMQAGTYKVTSNALGGAFTVQNITVTNKSIAQSIAVTPQMVVSGKFAQTIRTDGMDVSFYEMSGDWNGGKVYLTGQSLTDAWFVSTLAFKDQSLKWATHVGFYFEIDGTEHIIAVGDDRSNGVGVYRTTQQNGADTPVNDGKYVFTAAQKDAFMSETGLPVAVHYKDGMFAAYVKTDAVWTKVYEYTVTGATNKAITACGINVRTYQTNVNKTMKASGYKFGDESVLDANPLFGRTENDNGIALASDANGLQATLSGDANWKTHVKTLTDLTLTPDTWMVATFTVTGKDCNKWGQGAGILFKVGDTVYKVFAGSNNDASNGTTNGFHWCTHVEHKNNGNWACGTSYNWGNETSSKTIAVHYTSDGKIDLYTVDGSTLSKKTDTPIALTTSGNITEFGVYCRAQGGVTASITNIKYGTLADIGLTQQSNP